MSKRNSRYSIHKHLRMVLAAIPMRQEAALRLAIAARLDADEATGEVFARDGKSARQVLQDTAGIPHETTLKASFAFIRKLGLIFGRRVYAKGERQVGGDRLTLGWDTWDAAYEQHLLNVERACSQLSGLQPPCSQLNGPQPGQLNGLQGGQLNGPQHYKDTATVTATKTASKPPLAGAHYLGDPEATHVGATARNGDARKRAARPGELQRQLPEVVDDESIQLSRSEGVSWKEVGEVPPDPNGGPRLCGVWQDRGGGVHLVYNTSGRALWGRMMQAGYTAAHVAKAQEMVAEKLSKYSAQTWSMRALPEKALVTYCGYAKERMEKAVAGKAGRPAGYVDYAERDAVRNTGRFKINV